MNRTVAFRYEVYRGGAYYSELQAIGAPSIRMTASGEIKMALSGTFALNPAVDFLTDTLRPKMILDGKTYPLGEFYATTVPTVYADGTARLQLEAYDGCLILQQATLENLTTYARGRRYTDVIQEILSGAGVERVIVEESSETLQSDRADWEIGTSLLKVINDLLAEINYNSIYFDLEGNAKIRKRSQPALVDVTVTYESGETSLISSDCTTAQDTYTAYNVFVVLVSSPDFSVPMRAVSVNDDPGSPLSTVRRGRRIVAPVVKLDNIASQTALQEYADNLRLRSMSVGETVSFVTANNPIHSVGEILSLRHPKLAGIFEETEWSMDLSYDGQMEHKATRTTLLEPASSGPGGDSGGGGVDDGSGGASTTPVEIVRFRQETAETFTAENPVLAAGAPAHESDTNKLKIGDGTTAYNDLPYVLEGVAPTS